MKTLTTTITVLATADDQRNYKLLFHRALTEAELRNRIKVMWEKEREGMREAASGR